MATLVQPVSIEKTRESGGRLAGVRRLLGLASAHVHFCLTGLMAVALIPALHAARLPLRFDWPHLLEAWVGLMFQATFLACVLYVIGGPLRVTLRPVLLRYWNDKRRLILLVPLLAELGWLFGAAVAGLVTVAFVAFVELTERTRKQPGALLAATRSVMLPAAYLFAGLVMVFAYNNVIVSFRFFGAYDAVFNRLDSWILGGATVSGIAHHAGAHLSLGAYRFLEFVYFGMFSQIGAGIILVGLYRGMGKGSGWSGRCSQPTPWRSRASISGRATAPITVARFISESSPISLPLTARSRRCSSGRGLCGKVGESTASARTTILLSRACTSLSR
jgi:hypothetical protein